MCAYRLAATYGSSERGRALLDALEDLNESGCCLVAPEEGVRLHHQHDAARPG
jgi:hypothetical protein